MVATSTSRSGRAERGGETAPEEPCPPPARSSSTSALGGARCRRRTADRRGPRWGWPSLPARDHDAVFALPDLGDNPGIHLTLLDVPRAHHPELREKPGAPGVVVLEQSLVGNVLAIRLDGLADGDAPVADPSGQGVGDELADLTHRVQRTIGCPGDLHPLAEDLAGEGRAHDAGALQGIQDVGRGRLGGGLVIRFHDVPPAPAACIATASGSRTQTAKARWYP